jgi:hypothetical protein
MVNNEEQSMFERALAFYGLLSQKEQQVRLEAQFETLAVILECRLRSRIGDGNDATVGGGMLLESTLRDCVCADSDACGIDVAGTFSTGNHLQLLVI